MWRRQDKDEEHVKPDPQEVRSRWEEWEARWNPSEEERVGRWLRMKSAGEAAEAGSFDTTRDQLDWAVFEVPVSLEDQPDREIGPGEPSVSQDDAKAELVRLRDQRNDVAAALEAERSELADLEFERRQLAADLDAERVESERRRAELAAELEAERANLQERRRGLLAASDADQLDVDRVGRQHAETRRLLEAEVAALAAEVASLEDRRRAIVESMEAAVATAEEAREAELAAVAHLADVQEHAKKVEKEQFEIWVALDAEVTALRNHLNGGRGVE